MAKFMNKEKQELVQKYKLVSEMKEFIDPREYTELIIMIVEALALLEIKQEESPNICN